MWYDGLLERNRLPDWLLRRAIRRLCRQRLRDEDTGDPELQQARLNELLDKLRRSPLAAHPAEANAQHYEVPTEFYRHVLGRRLKYSCCLFPTPAATLDEAEEAMLRLTEERADLADGM